MIKYITIFIILMGSTYLDDTKKLFDEKAYIDNDKIQDKIMIHENEKTHVRYLTIFLSTYNKEEPFVVSKKAIPNFRETTLFCQKVNIDSLGFNFNIESSNGNNYLSRRFYFKFLYDDILLYKIEKNHITESAFRQEACTIHFYYENITGYDPKYSIKNFSYEDFW